MISQNNIVTVTSGDSVLIPCRVKDKDKVPIDISAMDIFFTAKDKFENILIRKDSITGNIVKEPQADPLTRGKFKVLLYQQDTYNFEGSVDYDIEFHLFDLQGNQGIITGLKGILSVVKDYTHAR